MKIELLDIAFGLGAITILVITFFVTILIITDTLIPDYQKYERAYNQCIASERLTEEQCHAIGLEAID